MVYTVTLNPALDYVMEVEGLRFDDINRARAEDIHYGGKGINVSAVLSRLGVDTKALGFVGGFTGKKLEEMLLTDNISCDFNYLKSGYTRINVKIKAHTEIDVNASGPTVDDEDIQDLLTKLDCAVENDFLVLAGAAPKNLPSDIYEKILKRLSGRRINFVVDATGDSFMNALKYRPFLVKPNHHELGDLFGIKADTDEIIQTYAKKLQNLGAKNVLVSRASKGAILIDEGGNTHKIGAAQGKIVNSVGCGDSMVAGFLAGYINSGDYSYALKLGSACGGATAFSLKLAAKDEIYRVLENL